MHNIKKKGFVCGVFDLFHLGHVLMLKECKNNCEWLIVAINKAENIDYEINPNKLRPLYSLEERVSIMQSCKYVDQVITYKSEDELYNIMKENNFSIRFLGSDYVGKKITGENLKIPLHFCDRSHGHSTSKYKKRLFEMMSNL